VVQLEAGTELIFGGNSTDRAAILRLSIVNFQHLDLGDVATKANLFIANQLSIDSNR